VIRARHSWNVLRRQRYQAVLTVMGMGATEGWQEGQDKWDARK